MIVNRGRAPGSYSGGARSHAPKRGVSVVPRRVVVATDEAGRPRRRSRDQAAQIVAAATRLFWERGYHDVGMADVGAQLGITGSAVYRHFANKGLLLVAVVERELARVVAEVSAVAARGETPRRTLELIDAVLARNTLRERALTALYLREVRHAPFEVRSGVRVSQRELTRLWRDALRGVRPELSDDEAEYVLLASYGVLSSHLFFVESGVTRRRLEHLLVTMALAAQLSWEPPDDRSTETPTGEAAPTPGAPRRVGEPAPPDGDDGVSVIVRASRREMILQAAAGLFRRYGYPGVGIDQIGAAAGISGPAVYRHFKGKDDLLVAAFQRAWEQMLAGVATVLADPADPAEVLSRLVESYVGVAFGNADLVVVYLRDAESLPEEHQRELRKDQRLYIEEWVRVLRRLRPDLDDAEARVRVHAAMGIVNSAVDIPTRLADGRARDVIVAMATSVLLDPEP